MDSILRIEKINSAKKGARRRKGSRAGISIYDFSGVDMCYLLAFSHEYFIFLASALLYCLFCLSAATRWHGFWRHSLLIYFACYAFIFFSISVERYIHSAYRSFRVRTNVSYIIILLFYRNGTWSCRHYKLIFLWLLKRRESLLNYGRTLLFIGKKTSKPRRSSGKGLWDRRSVKPSFCNLVNLNYVKKGVRCGMFFYCVWMFIKHTKRKGCWNRRCFRDSCRWHHSRRAFSALASENGQEIRCSKQTFGSKAVGEREVNKIIADEWNQPGRRFFDPIWILFHGFSRKKSPN